MSELVNNNNTVLLDYTSTYVPMRFGTIRSAMTFEQGKVQVIAIY